MSPLEFSSEFDILYNNIMSNKAPGLSEYEKSVLLTQAQEQLVLGIYNGTFDGNSFESTEVSKSYLSDIVKQKTYKDSEITKPNNYTIDSNSYIVDRLDDMWIVVYEEAEIKDSSIICLKDGKWVPVTSSTLDVFNRTKNNPFRGPNKRNVIRLSFEDKFELISKYPINSYKIRYIKKPYPIILESFENGETINGENKPYSDSTPCELHSSLHKSILNIAVSLAKALWTAQ